MDVIQFNLMNPHLTSVFNPLANAIQEFRRDNPVKGTALIDSIVETLFPDNGEIWNPAAGNMFRRAVYLLFDYYIEQEAYIRHVGFKDGVAPEVIDQEIDALYSKITLYNVYSLIGELAAKKSKDVEFINVNPNVPPVPEKDLLTVMFDAMSMLPTNVLREKAITANNAIKQIASAEQTIAGIYATLLTGLSVYADDTARALMSGSISESFDVTGLSFPRRFGVHFDEEYVKKFRITNELCKWTIYRDPQFEDRYEGDDYEHEERVSPTNWVWGHFAGIFDQEEVYMKLSIESRGTIIKEFFFKFTKGYKRFNGITYVIDPITRKKIVSGGTLVELDPETKKPHVGEFTTQQIDYETDSYKTVAKPVITANQVYYSERPKFIFAITPPHLQVYQKHILVIIKQIIDEIYSMSYVTKSTRKPILGTRFMLEEFGNIRSGENGIPNIDTVTSIALGQDVQLTFVLQSFQQLRSLYGEDIEKILRANSSNTIFLKSNDEELINELVRLSGTKHEFRVKSKSVSRKMGDLITVSEPIINYSGENVETTALVANDLLMLAGPSPGNSITFSSGEMPIVNKLATITPMAAGLHKQLPQERTKKNGDTAPYQDSTMPMPNSSSGNALDNLIDGEALVRARVEHAKISMGVREKIMNIAKASGVTISETNGDLAKLMMNIVYEIYDKDAGVARSTSASMAEPINYADMAERMIQATNTIKDAKGVSKEDRLMAATQLKEDLVKCAMDQNLADLTVIYKDSSSKTIIGYDPIAVSNFVNAFARKYPKKANLVTEHVDVYAEANKTKHLTGYHEYDGHDDLVFDMLNTHHIDALEEVVVQFIHGELSIPSGVRIEDYDDGIYALVIDRKEILLYNESNDSIDYKADPADISRIVASNSALLSVIQSFIEENY